MNQQLINTLLLAGAFLLLFAVAELLYHKLHVKVEITRKIVHFGTGIITLLFPILLDNHWLVLFLCTSFAVILIISLKFNLLKSINAIERESVGSIAYPVSVYSCYLVYQLYNHHYFYFYLPILILAVCDPLAALFGKRWPKGKYKIGKDNKTLMGSSMFFISALLLCGFILVPNLTYGVGGIIAACIFVSVITTIAEACSGKGYDNITIPFATVSCLTVIQQFA